MVGCKGAPSSHTFSHRGSTDTGTRKEERRGRATPATASSQQAMQHGQQPAPQAQELHGASRGAGGAASAKPQQTRAGAGWKEKGQKRDKGKQAALARRKEEEGRPRGTSQQNGTHTIRNATAPSPPYTGSNHRPQGIPWRGVWHVRGYTFITPPDPSLLLPASQGPRPPAATHQRKASTGAGHSARSGSSGSAAGGLRQERKD